MKKKKIHRSKTIRRIWNLVQERNFELSKTEIKTLQRHSNARLTATIEIYRCYAFSDKRNQILLECLKSKNPRKREYACDVIGDESINELNREMEKLLADPVKDVRDSAKANVGLI